MTRNFTLVRAPSRSATRPRFAADADDLGGNDSALPGRFDVEGQRVEGGFHSLYAPRAFAGAIERERDTASFITRNPPVASRFTPFIPFPLSSIGDGLTIFIRQETQTEVPVQGCGCATRITVRNAAKTALPAAPRVAQTGQRMTLTGGMSFRATEPGGGPAAQATRSHEVSRAPSAGCGGLRTRRDVAMGGRQRVFALLLAGGW